MQVEIQNNHSILQTWILDSKHDRSHMCMVRCFALKNNWIREKSFGIQKDFYDKFVKISKTVHIVKN